MARKPPHLQATLRRIVATTTTTLVLLSIVGVVDDEAMVPKATIDDRWVTVALTNCPPKNKEQ
jgi:hypothetical protein